MLLLNDASVQTYLITRVERRLFAQYPCRDLEDVIRVSELGVMQMTLAVCELSLIKY